MDTLRVKMCAFARACLERMQALRIAQAEMLYISLRMWGELGEEEDSSRQYLTTRMLRIDPLLTGEPVSPVRRHVDAVVKDSQQIDALEALLREKRRGGRPSNLSPEILSQLQKIGELIAQSPSTSKGGLVTRSATRGGRGFRTCEDW
jgi:hypothetical protein